MEYSLEKMDEYLKNGLAIDATMGGLILGKSHSQGGIYFWVKRDNVFVLEGEVEGYEYIMNQGASHCFSESTYRFHQPELHKHDFIDYEPDLNIKLLDTRDLGDPKFLLFDSGGFSIINKWSTKGYLKTIDEMNKAVTIEKIDEKNARLVYNSNKPIEIFYYDKYEGYISKL
ncbi:hypothetical protein [Aquimarina algicola]|uniref:Uncharacterized protein n=1 Tax=Aquimarina algicola TaxID=2589995 RepID=A0A504JLF9_9FLAO|nr:hypothetical protein [Aquimarina algicola]TPN87411.1 hypothetical protein FHK87_07460 [Aquimarina algicola]